MLLQPYGMLGVDVPRGLFAGRRPFNTPSRHITSCLTLRGMHSIEWDLDM